MNIIHKHVLNVNLADAAATNNNSPITGVAAGGGYVNGISGLTAVGIPVAISTGMGVGVIPTKIAEFVPLMQTSMVYDIRLDNAVAIAGQPHTYKVPISILNFDDVNQSVDSVYFMNSFDIVSKDIFPLSRSFFYKYSVADKAIYFGFADADAATYVGKGLKLHLTVISTKN